VFSDEKEKHMCLLKPGDSDTIVWKWTIFKEIKQAIKFLSFRKASESDKISFLILQQAFQTIFELFFAIFAKLLNNNYHSTINMLMSGNWCYFRKEKKPNYSALKTY